MLENLVQIVGVETSVNLFIVNFDSFAETIPKYRKGKIENDQDLHVLQCDYFRHDDTTLL